MAFSHKVNRVTIQGTAFNGEEIWNTGFYMGAAGADAGLPTELAAQRINSFWQTFFQGSQNKISNQYLTYTVKVARLNTNGTTEADSVKYYDATTPYAGNSSGTSWPPQIALVGTLVTAAARGLGSKGRMYLPGIQAALDTNAKISITDRGNLATNLAAMFNGINADADVPGTVITASFGRVSPATVGVNEVVTGVRVGNVYDTQRRRRNALVESYSTANVT